MNEKMIDKLRTKFNLISFFALFATLVFAVGLTTVINMHITRKNTQKTLQYIIENDGTIPERHKDHNDDSRDVDYTVIRFLNEIFNREETNNEMDSPEFYYITRYFAILYEADGSISEIITSHISSITEEEARIYGDLALSKKASYGKNEGYYYQVADRSQGGKIVVYLDSTNMFLTNARIFYIALSLMMIGVVISMIFTTFFSRWALKSEVENAEIQKRFVTNASHELKTPLAVIRANTEMLEILEGENEWTQSTIRQVDHMTGLIQNLVTIVRADEELQDGDLQKCDVSQIIEDTVKNYHIVIEQDKKKLTEDIDQDVNMYAIESQIRQLCTILIDNAIKYCDDEGTISVGLHSSGKTVELTVANDYQEGENVNYKRFFERFYREDASHNMDKGGYGIGLSIAESIVNLYKGSIDVSWEKGIIRFRCILKTNAVPHAAKKAEKQA